MSGSLLISVALNHLLLAVEVRGLLHRAAIHNQRHLYLSENSTSAPATECVERL